MGSGVSTIAFTSGGGGTQTVNFLNLAPVLDLVVAATVTVNATNGDNAINYMQGSVVANGLVSIDNQETYEFSNKDNLVINALAGSDTVNLNNSSRPTGATLGGLKNISVVGADPTGSDTLIVNGVAGSIDDLQFAPTGTGSGTVTENNLLPAFTPVTFSGIEHMSMVGQSADGDSFRELGTVGNDTFDVTPGAVSDAGTITGFEAGPGNFNFTPVAYSGFRNYVMVSPLAAGTDTLLVDGTSANDTFAFDGASAPFGPGSAGIVVNTGANIHTPIFFGAGLSNVVLRGLDGNDTFNVNMNPVPVTTASTALRIEGGAGSNAINYTAPFAAATTIDYGAATIASTGANLVTFAGIATINETSSGAATLTINGTAGPDNFNYTPTGIAAGTVSLAGTNPIINFTGVGSTFTIDPLAGADAVNVNGTSGNDTVNVVGGAVTTTVEVVGFKLLNMPTANTEAVNVFGLQGNDTFNVTPSLTVPIFIDGGDPIGVTPPLAPPNGDQLNIIPNGNPVSFSQGPHSDEGSFVVNSDQPVSFAHIERAGLVGPVGPVNINGTNEDDSITITAIDAANQAQFGAVGADGFEDSAVQMSDSLTLILINAPVINVNAQAGNDTIVIQAPAPLNEDWNVTVNVDGGPPSASGSTLGDTVAVETPGTAVQTVGYTPTGVNSGTVALSTITSTVNLTDVESLTFNGHENNDLFTVNGTALDDTIVAMPGPNTDAGTLKVNNLLGVTYQDLGPTAVVTVAGAAGNDRMIVNGGAANDIFGVAAATGTVTLNSDLPILQTAVENLVLNGFAGDDRFNIHGAVPYATTTLNGGDPTASDIVNLTGATGAVTVNLADSTLAVPTDTTVVGYGGVVTLNGVEVANLDAAGNALTVVGTSQNDVITYTPTGASAGTFTNAGLNTVFNFTTVTGAFTVAGGTGNGADQLILDGTNSRDLFEINQGARTAQVLSNNVTALKTVTIDPTIEELTANGLAGQDTFQIIPAAGVGAFPQDNLLINVDGGAGTGENNALVIGASFGASPATLPATSFVVVNRNAAANSGTVRVFQSAVADPDINYQNVQVVSPVVAGSGLNPNLLILGPDTNEPNENQGNSTFLGSGPTLQIQHASIFPNSAEFPGVPSDNDFYRVVAYSTGTLDFQVYFRLFSAALLPAGGNINLQVLDSTGAIVGTASGGAAAFGAEGATGNARVRIPAIVGQSYYLRVFGANPDGTANSIVVNGYDATIVSTPAPQPFNLQLSRSTTQAGAPDTGDLPPNAPNSDSGRSQFDNVTNINTPRIYIRLNDGSLLNDLPGNGTTDTPPAGVIPIPFSPNATTPGFRVAIFDGNNTQTPVGFATQVDPVNFPGLYTFTFTTALADGIHHINSAVQMVDPQATRQTGFGLFSSISLDITVDTAVPPVFFGLAANPTDGLDSGSDSGVTGDNPTFTDRITNVTSPEFFGTAEANSIIRLFALNSTTGAQVLIGQTTAVPIDGTNAFPNGRWTITSNVNMNDPSLFMQDGIRHILVTAEDLAGNVSPPQQLDIFMDTQGPQVTNVQITSDPNFNLFGLKPGVAASPAPATTGPTPLVFSLTIPLQDSPATDTSGAGSTAEFPRTALDPKVFTPSNLKGLLKLTGDHNGVIAIDSISVNNPLITAGGVTPTASIVLNFVNALPDDRYTLTLSDTVPDVAGNKLDGENNAIQPTGTPIFPTGDGQPGGSFSARFTVDSRPEIGTYAAAAVYVDINGNLVWDPQGQNNDITNRDLTFNLGVAPSLAGTFSPMGVHDAVFAGNFGHLSDGSLVTDGFDKLAAYGFDPKVNGYRWLIDTNNDGVINPSDGDFATAQPAGFQINGLPVAGNFDGNSANGAEIGLFDGTSWWFDTNHDHVIDSGDLHISTQLRGLPIVGDFNGDGVIDLATWKDDKFYFNFGTGSPGSQPSWSGNIDATINFGLPGNGELPIAADMNGDGITDVGLYQPAKSGTLPTSSGTWEFLVSNDFAKAMRGGNQVNALNHLFSPSPLGNDIYAQFGDASALPIVGNFDPPIGSPTLPTPTSLGSVLAKNMTATPIGGSDQWFSFSPLRTGTASVSTNSSPGTNVDAYIYDTNYNLLGSASGTAVGQMTANAAVTASQNYLIRVAGNSATNLHVGSQVPDSDRLDVSRDGNISALDALQVINDLIVNGSHATPQVAGDPGLYLDTSLDGQISPLDALQVINYLVSHSPGLATSQSLTSQSLASATTAPIAAPLTTAGPSDASAAVAFGLSVSGKASSTSGAASPAISPAPADLVYAQLASGASAISATSVLEPDDESGVLSGTEADGASSNEDWDWLS